MTLLDHAPMLCLRSLVTDGATGLSPDSRLNADRMAPTFGKRVVEWFWRSSTIDAWAKVEPRQRALELGARAKLSADLALVAWTTAEPLGEASACELYRQSAYWALCALTPSASPAATGEYAEAVWAMLDEPSLLSLAATAGEREVLRARLSSGTFVTFAELSRAEQIATRAAYRDLTTLLLARVAETQTGLRKLHAQRTWRLSGLAVLVAGMLFGMLMLRAHIARRGDFAIGAEWRTSSNYGGGCTSPDQECDGANGYFFHTQVDDPEPWIAFELAGAKTVSTVLVENRDDCCAERAVPLVVELSDDGTRWHQVAERSEQFSTWRAAFPAARARYVRLRVERPSALHLKRVRISP